MGFRTVSWLRRSCIPFSIFRRTGGIYSATPHSDALPGRNDSVSSQIPSFRLFQNSAEMGHVEIFQRPSAHVFFAAPNRFKNLSKDWLRIVQQPLDVPLSRVGPHEFTASVWCLKYKRRRQSGLIGHWSPAIQGKENTVANLASMVSRPPGWLWKDGQSVQFGMKLMSRPLAGQSSLCDDEG
jgi:hypothetical protein